KPSRGATSTSSTLGRWVTAASPPDKRSERKPAAMGGRQRRRSCQKGDGRCLRSCGNFPKAVADSATKDPMDEIDWKIVAALQQNARLTNQELAQKVGLSPSPCLRRLRKLEEQGVLRGYCALVDQERYGLPINVFVSIRLERQTDAAIRAFEQAIQDLDEVQECYLMTGARDYLLRVVSQSLQAYERFVRERLTRIEGIASIESSFAFNLVKKNPRLPPPVGRY